MKQFSLILNIVLLLAVGFLYYLHFKGWHNERKFTAVDASGKVQSCPASTIPVIAYVDQDSLSADVGFIKTKEDELKDKQKSIQVAYDNAMMDLQNKGKEFLKKGSAITQQEYDAFQQEMGQNQQQIEGDKQKKMQDLAEENAKFLEVTQDKLKDFLADYNKSKKYTYILATGTGLDYLFYKDSTLNITQDVIKGLNTQTKTDNP
jgi:outer membrane protein